jgi:two-component system invasion response regulator UvrY
VHVQRLQKKRLWIAITEDHATTRVGMKQILKAEFPQVSFGEASDEAGTLALVRKRPWDLLILDLSLPGRSGVEVLGEVKRLRPELPVLIFSAHREEEFAIHVLRAQASGYLVKERAPEELCRAVRHILQRGTYLSDTLGRRLMKAVASGSAALPHENLSHREFEVFQRVARGESGKEIAADLRLSPKTVSTYRTRILTKLQLRTTSDLIRYAIRERLV